MQTELLHLHVQLLLYLVLNLNELYHYADGWLSQCSEQKQVQNDVDFDVALLAVAVIQAAKNQSFPVHFVDMSKFLKEILF